MSGSNSVFDATTNILYTNTAPANTGSYASVVITSTPLNAAIAAVDALPAASPADDLQLTGIFVENLPYITHSMTIESVGGTLAAVSNPQSLPPLNGRAILNVIGDKGVNLTVSGLKITGANNDSEANSPENAAGILFETGNGILNVNNCVILNNEDGILTGGPDAASPNGTMSVFINQSEIGNNGAPYPDVRFGFDHNIYAGNLTELMVTNSYIHDAIGGHEIKSRATTTIIENNRIQDGPTAPASYGIDIPEGGTAIVTGNTLEKGSYSSQDNFIHFGGEAGSAGEIGNNYPVSSLDLENNVFIAEIPVTHGATTALYNQSQTPVLSNGTFVPSNVNIPATIANNTLFGVDYLSHDQYGPPADNASGNLFLPLAQAPALSTASPVNFSVACFAAGTQIATAHGFVAVEALRVGVSVMTSHDGGTAPVIWIGRRTIVCAGHPAPETVRPIRVARGAFAAGQPERDLHLSPDHAVYVDGGLIPIQMLVNGVSITQPTNTSEVTYFHVELAHHAILLAEGVWAESYLDTGNRTMFDNADRRTFTGAHGDRASASCVSLITEPTAVRAAWRRLASRVGVTEKGAAPCKDPDVRLRLGGRDLRPAASGLDRYFFQIPRAGGVVTLISRAARPSDSSPWIDDRRRLGVKVRRLRLRHKRAIQDIPLDHPCLTLGWWQTEWTEAAPERWTDGAAVLGWVAGGQLEVVLSGLAR